MPLFSMSQPAGCLQLLRAWSTSQPALQAMGADEAVDYTVEKFDDKFQNDKFDVVVDTIGGKLCIGWGINNAVSLFLPMLTGALCVVTLCAQSCVPGCCAAVLDMGKLLNWSVPLRLYARLPWLARH